MTPEAIVAHREGEYSISRQAFTGTLRDGRCYIQVWRGWILRSYHWVDQRVKKWIDVLIALGNASAEAAFALAEVIGLTPGETSSLWNQLLSMGVLVSWPNGDASPCIPHQSNLGVLPHSPVEGHFNHELLKTNSPYSVKFEVSTKCNLRCGFCYVANVSQQHYISLEDAVTVLKRLRTAGVVELSLTGLEATLHPGIAQVVSTSERLGFRTMLLTNGLCFRDDLWEVLACSRRTEVRITYHSCDDQQFDAFVGLHGARRAIRLNLVRLRDVGVPVVATVVVNRTNESWIRATVAELESERIPYLVSSIILPNVGKVRSPLETNDYLSSTAVLSDLLKHGITHRRRRECAAARTKAWVASNGDVFACELAKSLPIGNVLKTDFLKVWGSETAEEMRSHYGLEPDRCRTCSSRPRCPHCPALAELERGRPDAVYSVFCETTTFIERQHTQSPGDGLENGNSKPVGRKSAIQS